MADAFKNVFSTQLISLMGMHLERVDPRFQRKRFTRLASRQLDSLELKERSNQIRSALERTLSRNFREACEHLLATLHKGPDFDLSDMGSDEHGIRGLGIMPMADFVAARGLDDFDFSMGVLRDMTKLSSSEFAVRPFLLHDPERALSHVEAWTQDKNQHVRRLASEGCRPRLPWGMRLRPFVEDPSPILPILESLKDDSAEYVRRSVANNLNDISKDHPNIVSGIAEWWLDGASTNRKRLVNHACRSLIKSGHKPTLKALGYRKPKLRVLSFDVHTQTVTLGDRLAFSLELVSESASPQPIIVDFIVHHRKSNGSLSPKVFKLKTLTLPAGQSVQISKNHPMKPITTRAYYAGQHALEVQINGESVGQLVFELSV